MRMKNPPHPGLSVRHDCIEPCDLTITEAAAILGVTRQTLNNLVNGKAGISPEMAIRLDKAFGGGAETWLRLQMAYDLAQARQPKARLRSSGLCDGSWKSRAREAETGGTVPNAYIHRNRCWGSVACRVCSAGCGPSFVALMGSSVDLALAIVQHSKRC